MSICQMLVLALTVKAVPYCLFILRSWGGFSPAVHGEKFELKTNFWR